MAYFIDKECIGCMLCLKACPVICIDGGPKRLHSIDSTVCIDCGVCATYCPVDCIMDGNGVKQPKIAGGPKARPIAMVDEDNCTGCEWCADACPFDCLEMVPLPGEEGKPTSQMSKIARNVHPKDCVGCKLCEEVCVQKNAITIRWPDGRYADTIGVPSVKLADPIHVP